MTIGGVFITGTDTDVGKTWIAAGLLAGLRRCGVRAVGMKPVSCGCDVTAEGPRNADAVTLIEQGAHGAPYALVNRYAFIPPVAPHLAAQSAGTTIDLSLIRKDFDELRDRADFVVVEGVGGWYVPLNDRETVADLAKLLDLPVLLVVGIRLGCLNHALLSAAAIQTTGLELMGWVANVIDPHTLRVEENIESLRHRIPAPLLGIVPYLGEFDALAIADRCHASSVSRIFCSAFFSSWRMRSADT
jgi:dethiobiotin synthetase